jgi:hypothetical protein
MREGDRPTLPTVAHTLPPFTHQSESLSNHHAEEFPSRMRWGRKAGKGRCHLVNLARPAASQSLQHLRAAAKRIRAALHGTAGTGAGHPQEATDRNPFVPPVAHGDIAHQAERGTFLTGSVARGAPRGVVKLAHPLLCRERFQAFPKRKTAAPASPGSAAV